MIHVDNKNSSTSPRPKSLDSKVSWVMIILLQFIAATYYLAAAIGAVFGDPSALGGTARAHWILLVALIGLTLLLASAVGIIRVARWAVWTMWLTLLPLSFQSVVGLMVPLQIFQAIMYMRLVRKRAA